MSDKNVIDLNQYRNRKHRDWLVKNESKIEDVIRYYLLNTFNLDMAALTDIYQTQKRDCFDDSWDYLDLRELIGDIFVEANILDSIIDDLKSKRWFDEKQICRQKILEICLSIFVLETGISA